MRIFVFILLFLFSKKIDAQKISEFIHIDQFGYQINSKKVAVLSNPKVGYNRNLNFTPSTTIEVRNAINDNVVYSGAPIKWNNGAIHDQSGDKGWWFDFSSIIVPGEYYILDVANEERSGNFVISDDVYSTILKSAGRMFYYNRCNMEKTSEYAGKWSDGNSFLNPLQDANCRYIYNASNSALEKDLSGGWFDAGDYNKYVTFTNSTLHNLLSAYEENPNAFSDDWNIPESGNGIPDIIDEIKWELDWLFKMTNSDGSVHIKVGSKNYSDNSSSPPSINTDQRFYGPTCSSASITVASVFAHAAKVFGGIPSLSNYSNDLLQTAKICFDYSKSFVDSGNYETNCDDQSIVSGDSDRNAEQQLGSFITAAIYLYEQTNLAYYHNYIIDNVSDLPQIKNTLWGPYYTQNNDALILYSQLNTADVEIANSIKNAFATDISNNYSDYYGFSNNDLYRAQMPSWSYHWGSNQAKASYGILNKLVIQSGTQDDISDFNQYIDEVIHYFHGVNPQNVVYLSNMYDLGAEKSINEIYHAWFADGTKYDHAINSPIGPAPGFVPGGPNKDFSVSGVVPPYNQPAQKSYLDFNTNYPQNSWEISEPAIYYQAAYLRVLANRVELEQAPDLSIISTQENISCFNHCNGKISINEIKNGNSPFTYNWSNGQSSSTIDSLCEGTYFVTVTDSKNFEVTDSFIISQPKELIVNISSTNETYKDANNGTATSNPTGGIAPYSYLWSNGENTQTIINLMPKQYSVTVTDANSCSSVSTVNIDSFICLDLSINSQINNVSCYNACDGKIAVINVENAKLPLIYSWNIGENTATLSNLCVGEYIVSITDANNCGASDTIIIAQPDEITITIDSTKDVRINSPGFIAITTNNNGNYRFDWIGPGNFTANTEDLNNLSDFGCYMLTVSDTVTTCSIDTTICIEDKTATSDIHFKDINIYPNPTKNNFIIDFNNSKIQDAKIIIFDVSGKQYSELEKHIEDKSIIIESDLMKAGLYIIKIKSATSVTIFSKVIIIK